MSKYDKGNKYLLLSTDMQSLSKYDKGNKYLLCADDLFSKYVWVIRIKDKKRNSIVNAFKKKSQKEENQIKYGLIKVVNSIVIVLKIF